MGNSITGFSCTSQQVKLAEIKTNMACKIITMDIHQKLKSARERARLSQSDLARKLGVKPQSVQQWEAPNGTAPSRKRLEEVAKILGVTVAELMSNEPAVAFSRSPMKESQQGAQRMELKEALREVWEGIEEWLRLEGLEASTEKKIELATALYFLFLELERDEAGKRLNDILHLTFD